MLWARPRFSLPVVSFGFCLFCCLGALFAIFESNPCFSFIEFCCKDLSSFCFLTVNQQTHCQFDWLCDWFWCVNITSSTIFESNKLFLSIVSLEFYLFCLFDALYAIFESNPFSLLLSFVVIIYQVSFVSINQHMHC